MARNYLSGSINKALAIIECVGNSPKPLKASQVAKFTKLDRATTFRILIYLTSLGYIFKDNNPPKLIIEFFEEQKNLEKISCFSDEGDNWDKSQLKLVKNKLYIKFRDKFNFRRGRINCSLNDTNGWRWFGIQFSIEKN